jgi:hypothetical protein
VGWSALGLAAYLGLPWRPDPAFTRGGVGRAVVTVGDQVRGVVGTRVLVLFESDAVAGLGETGGVEADPVDEVVGALDGVPSLQPGELV